MGDLRLAFRPEFLNRLDETILFHRLGREDVRQVVDIQIARFTKRLAQRELSLDITDAAKDFLANVGYDPTYGARPLKRAIQRHLENPLAQEILGGRYQAGDTVTVDVANGDLAFGRRSGDGPSREPVVNARGGANA